MKQYFANISGQTAGPFTIEQMKKLVASGHVVAATPISFDQSSFFLASTLPELGFQRAAVAAKPSAEKQIATSFCPCCSGKISSYEAICPHCNYDICKDAEERFRQQEELMHPNVVGTFIDRTPGARQLSQSMGLDFNIEKLTVAGWGLIVVTATVALASVIVATRSFATQSSDRAYIRLLAIATTVIPGALVFWSGRFFLSLAGVKIMKD